MYSEQLDVIKYSGPDHVTCPPCLAWFLQYAPDEKNGISGFRTDARQMVLRNLRHGETLRGFMDLASHSFFMTVLRQILPSPRPLVPVLTDEHCA